MAKAKVKTKKAGKGAKKRKAKKGLVGKTTGVGVCETWLVAFSDKRIKTQEQCTAFMQSEFPGRESAVFNYPNVVIGRANRGLLTHGKKPKKPFSKYPVDKKPKKD